VVFFPDYDLSRQYRVIQALHPTTISVPELLGFESDPAVLGSPFYVAERLEGESCSDYPPGVHGHGPLFDAAPEMRREMWLHGVRTMADIHTLDWRALGLEFLGEPDDADGALAAQTAWLHRILEYANRGPTPALDAGLAWVTEHRPRPSRLRVWGGAPKIGHLLWHDGKVTGVLDWEMAFLGPPEADLAYWLVVDEVAAATYDVPRLEGLPSATETVHAYEGFTNMPVEDLDYHIVFQTLRLGVLLTLADKLDKDLGLGFFPADYAINNYPTHRLHALLGPES
jgi:aminoglycoside phosphotransferase (APT) family kinase protein